MSSNLRGISFALAAGIFLTSNDAVSKWLVPMYPPGQILFFTSLSVAVIIWILNQVAGKPPIEIKNWWTHISRGLLFAISAFAFITALKYLPLADTMCIAFAAPLIITFLGKVILNEQVGRYRLTAVLLGFIGVIIMIQPGTTGFRWILLLPLVVAFSDASRDILTRKMTRSESSQSMVFTTSMTVAAISLTTYYAGWKPFEIGHLWLFGLKSCLMLVAYFLLIEAYRYAPTVVIAPFRYIQIIWGILAGLLLWQDIPDLHIFVGIILTVGSGIFIAIREARLASRGSL